MYLVTCVCVYACVCVACRLVHADRCLVGSGVNHDGRTSGFTVPNPMAQADLFSQTMAEAGVPADTISYVEVAANGSALGDPIELAALTRAFRRQTERSGFCAIGAVKSNLGHPEAASGMAQMAKALLQLFHRQLVPMTECPSKVFLMLPY